MPYFFFFLQPEYSLPSEAAKLVRWVLRNKILKRKEVLKHPCVLSPPWNLVPRLGAHIPPPPLLLSLSEFYIVLQPPPFYFFSLPTLILRHYGKVLVGKKKVSWECTESSKARCR